MKIKYIVASIWAFAEATFFFFIPDIYLTRIALSNFRTAIIACFFAASSACLGGALMYYWGYINFQHSTQFLLHIPGIFPNLIKHVISSVNDKPYIGLLSAPLLGIPYKIYAVVFGALKINFFIFLLISFIARILRFFLTTILTGLIIKFFCKNISRKKLYSLHIFFWGIIYVVYFILDVYSYY